MPGTKKIQLLRVNQFLASWNDAEWRPEDGLPKPDDHFFIGSMSIDDLRALSGVTERKTDHRNMPKVVQGYQRAHEPKRSEKIGRYIKYGYPLSTSLGIEPQDHRELINPGWLPNAIIVNIMKPGEKRMKNGRLREVPQELEVTINENNGGYSLTFPEPDQVKEFTKRKTAFAPPVEVIDGQHRLYAVDYIGEISGKYEVPVVIFNQLSPNWQAYIFWTINVEPKRINPSLAFDLYPELRRQEWLTKGEAIKIYQEHRSQELTESLWRHEESPWKNRIELHGKRVAGHVSNAAFIRSLNSSFIRKWGKEDRIGGLFGSISSEDGVAYVLPWKRAQQAAFLIIVWSSLNYAIQRRTPDWAARLTTGEQMELDNDLAPGFAGPSTLLATDQGVRAIHNIFNAIFQLGYITLGLADWSLDDEEIDEDTSDDSITYAIQSIKEEKQIIKAIRDAANTAVNYFDWRTSSAPGLTPEESQMQSSYRGSSGYTLLTKKILMAIAKNAKLTEVQELARDAIKFMVKD